MSTELNIKKRRHSHILAVFEKKLQDSYFQTETDIDSLPKDSPLPALFYRLTSLITVYQNADEKRQKIFANQISSLTTSCPQIRNCYKTINGKRQDLATYSLEMHDAKWAAYMINGEHTADRLAREKFTAQENRYGEHDIFDNEDDEPPYQKTQKQKELLFLMYASKGNAFLPEDSIIQMFTKELDISAHHVISLKMDDNEFYKTTPFMYFLQNHYYSEQDPVVPKYTGTHFYLGADFKLQNFEGDTLPEALLTANLFEVFGDYYAHKPEEAKAPALTLKIQQQPTQKTEDLFSMLPQTTKQSMETEAPPIHADTLFPLDEVVTEETTKTQPTKPQLITQHKKVDETPDLPFLDFQRD